MTNLENNAIPFTLTSSSTTTIPYEIPVTNRQSVLFSNNLGVWGQTGSLLEITSVPSAQAPQLLPALSVTVSTAASSAIPTATTVDIVRAYTSGLNILVPRIGLIPGARLPSGVAHIGAEASRGLVYQVEPYGSARTYYPKPYEVPLFEIPLNDKLFKAGTKAKMQFDLYVQSKGANATGQWFCIVDVGSVTSVAAPSTQSDNITGITYNATPILAQRLLVTGESIGHDLGVEVLATTATIMNANSYAYGVWSPVSASAPSNRNFILRGRLANFDILDNQGDPRGWMGYALRPFSGSDQIKLVVE